MKHLIRQTVLSVLVAFSLLIPMTAAQSANGPVTRMVITTGLDAKAYPVSNLSTVDSTIGRVLFYTEIAGIPGIPVAHRWIYQGVLVANVVLPVNASYVRVWSWLNVDSTMVGQWEAQVTDINGYILGTRSFQIVNPRDQSVQNRVRSRLRNDCEDHVLDLFEQLEKDPTNIYLQFLLEQQLSRCS